MADSSAEQRDRPLSPHLQVYRLPLTARMSILHRFTGVALTAGTVMVAWWLVAAATSEDAYNTAMDFAQSPLGTFMIFGWSLALFYHLSNGIRHMFWDVGYLFKKENANRAGYLVLLSTVILTAGAWYCATLGQEAKVPQGLDELAQAQIEGAAEESIQ